MISAGLESHEEWVALRALSAADGEAESRPFFDATRETRSTPEQWVIDTLNDAFRVYIDANNNMMIRALGRRGCLAKGVVNNN